MPAPRLSPPDLPAAVTGATKAFWGGLSRLRGGRAIHTDGAVFRGTFRRAPGPSRTGTELFDTNQQRTVLVRLSRSVGLPQPLPDALGCAVRFEDAYGQGRHQDLALATAVAGGSTLRDTPWFQRDFFSGLYSTYLPYIMDGERRMIGMVAEGGSARTVDALRSAALFRIRVVVAPVVGEWFNVGTIDVELLACDLPQTALQRLHHRRRPAAVERRQRGASVTRPTSPARSRTRASRPRVSCSSSGDLEDEAADALAPGQSGGCWRRRCTCSCANVPSTSTSARRATPGRQDAVLGEPAGAARRPTRRTGRSCRA